MSGEREAGRDIKLRRETEGRKKAFAKQLYSWIFWLLFYSTEMAHLPPDKSHYLVGDGSAS